MQWMWRMALAVALVAGAVLSGGGAAGSALAATGEVRSGESERIDQWVEERMEAHGTPGAAVAVVRGGEVTHLAGYGSAGPSGDPVTPDTAFVIGSASKPFTAMVIRQLVDEGTLSLDDRVAPYLADVAEHMPEGFEDVTVEHLLTHTGGLSMAVGLAGTVEVREGPDALDRRVAEVLDAPLAGTPGEEFEYSNAGAMLLAAVAEQATGERFADLLRERVFDPVGMSGSFASADDPRAEALATGHRAWFGSWRPSALPYDDAGVAMGYTAATASDLAKFVQAHLDGEPAEAIPATASDIARGPVVGTGGDEPLEGGHAMGWFVDDFAGQRVVSHAGSLGHFTTQLVLAPEQDLGIAVASNSSAFVAAGHAGQYDLSLGLASLLLDQPYEPAEAGALLSLVVPIIAWATAALIAIAAGRYVTVTMRRAGRGSRGDARGLRRWLRPVVLPDAAYIGAGAILLTAVPLDVARHFYPDAGWGLTVTAWLALLWGALRTALAVRGVRSAERPGVAPSESPAAGDRALAGTVSVG